jgi:RNA polymerase subunit RPABC4/transcription elongation factor Spt4
MEWCPQCGKEQKESKLCPVCETILSTYNPSGESSIIDKDKLIELYEIFKKDMELIGDNCGESMCGYTVNNVSKSVCLFYEVCGGELLIVQKGE